MAKSEISKWMPIEIDRFFASPRVQAMRDFQKWWYMALLMRAWQFDPPCHLPADYEQLRILAGAPPEKAWREYGKLVTDCFSAAGDSGLIANVAQLEVFHNQLAKHLKNQENGKRGAETRWRKHSEAIAPLCGANSSTSLSVSDSVSDVVVEKRKPANEKKVFLLPVWVNEKTWMDFELMRNAKNKKMTDGIRSRILGRLAKFLECGHDPNEILDTSIRNSWQDVFEPETKGNYGTRKGNEPSKNQQREQRASEVAANLSRKFFGDSDMGDGGVPQQAHGGSERSHDGVDMGEAAEVIPPAHRGHGIR